MAKDIGPGSLVRCVDDSPHKGRFITPLRAGKIYDVFDVETIPYHQLAITDYPTYDGKTLWWRVERFVPIDDDEIEIFRKLVVNPPKELIDA